MLDSFEYFYQYKKKVALALYLFNWSKTNEVILGVGPSSKVKNSSFLSALKRQVYLEKYFSKIPGVLIK
jgi:hypothetical protein